MLLHIVHIMLAFTKIARGCSWKYKPIDRDIMHRKRIHGGQWQAWHSMDSTPKQADGSDAANTAKPTVYMLHANTTIGSM
jgi:hypothetical protein